MEKIEVFYTKISEIRGTKYYHKYIVYTDSNGKKTAARGGPGATPVGDQFSNLTGAQSGVAVSGDSPFGNIVTDHGSYDKGFIDYDDKGKDSGEVIASGSDLSDSWDDITQAMDDIESESHPYRPITQNSNTTVDEALDRAGLNQPAKDGFDDNWSPGSGDDLWTAPSPQDVVDEYNRLAVWAEELANESADAAEAVLDDVGNWLDEQVGNIVDNIEEGSDAVVEGASEFADAFAEKYKQLKEESLSDAKDFLKDNLDNLGDLAKKARDIFDDVANEAGDFIDDVKDFFDRSAAIRNYASPLVFDLDGNGIELTSLDSSTVQFDLDANGFAETTGWVSPNDGILVFDRNHNGSIDNGHELFGNYTLINGGNDIALDGFSALSDLDTNGDSIINASDQQFSELKIWQDANQDGKSDSSELSLLNNLNISSINLNASSSNQVVNGNLVPLVSTFTRNDGSTGDVGDVFFQVDKINSEFVGEYSLTLDALLSPSVRGYGNVADLHVAASQNENLLALVQDFSNVDFIGGYGNLVSDVEAIIFEWTGTSNIDPNSRGGIFDARKLEALEAFLSTDFRNFMGSGDPRSQNVTGLNAAWNKLFDHIQASLVIQSFGADIYSSASYSFTTDSINFSQTIDVVVAELKAKQPQGTSNSVAYWLNNHRVLNALADIFVADIGTTISDALEGTLLEAVGGKFGSEHITGSEGNDVLTQSGSSGFIITAGGGNDTLNSGSGNNLLYGEAGDDTLQSTGGSDTLLGGAGDDTLITHGVGDDILDGGAGNDTLTAGSYSNAVLLGGEGDDTLSVYNSKYTKDRQYSHTGGKGNDQINGFYGADTYHFNRGDGQDTIYDYSGGYSNEDRIVFGEGVEKEELWFSHDGNDLLIQTLGTEDEIRVSGWYSSADYKVEEVTVSDQKLGLGSLEQLVSAMSAFSAPSDGAISLTSEERAQVNVVISSAWQPA